MLLMPVLESERQKAVCEFETILVYIVSSRLARGHIVRPSLSHTHTRVWDYSLLVEYLPTTYMVLNPVFNTEENNVF